MSSETARYFARLRTHLRLGDGVEQDLLREFEAHVEDRVASLVRRGVPEERARRRALEGFGRPQTFAHLLRQAQLRTRWGEALLGGAAFALVAALLGLQLWDSPFVAAGASAAVVAVTLYGLWAGRPPWFYPWAGVALTMPVIAGYIAFSVLAREAPHLGHDPLSPVALAGVAGAMLYFPAGFVVVAAGVLVAVRRDWLDASVLLSPLPAALAFTIAVHREGGLIGADPALAGGAAMLAGVYLCSALATVVFLRAPTRAARIMTLSGSALGLLLISTVLIDPSGGVLLLCGRAALLLAFLFSPALVARQA
ncbi:MAG TPA: permease prefix domain 1-containing protein [Dehalococcoidia bacterium]|nr:permease prefix domain 1-containing protein [Dehalococcoidia bacterium]